MSHTWLTIPWSVIMDLSEAFDILNHDLLIVKLHVYSFKNFKNIKTLKLLHKGGKKKK